MQNSKCTLLFRSGKTAAAVVSQKVKLSLLRKLSFVELIEMMDIYDPQRINCMNHILKSK